MSAKKIIVLGFLAMSLFSLTLWTILEKSNSYKDIDVRVVQNVVRVASNGAFLYVFDIQTGKDISKLEIKVNGPRPAMPYYGTPNKLITIRYVCGYNKNCGRFKSSLPLQKMEVEDLRMFLHSADEIHTLP
ncbi:MAG: hypothetical protein Q7R75_00995 [bacterium]|nr:hypothetical protein [bacterium]